MRSRFAIIASALLIYAVLVVLYVLAVFEYLDTTLLQLARSARWEYALVCLAIIVFQGVILEALASWLLRQIGLGADGV